MMERALYNTVLLCVLSIAMVVHAQTSATADEKIFLGLLDDAREDMANWKPGVSQQRFIRLGFERNREGWKMVPATSLPSHMKWTVAFDGKNLAEVESRADPEPDAMVQKMLTPASSIPTVGAPSSRFAGLLAMGPTKIRRPLVVVSKPYVADPDGWKRLDKAPDKIGAQVRSAFRRNFPHAIRCKDEEVLQRDWKFPDSAFHILTVYGSNKRSFLVEIRLNAGDCGYVDDPNDPLSDHWFFVSEAGVVRRAGSFMTLLDAGDYDNDGRSELVFFLSQPEDTDGFVLFDANLHEQGRLTWTYH